MRKKIKVPDDFDKSITDYLNKKISTSDIALRHNVAKATVLKWFDEAGIERHNRGVMISVKMTGTPGRRLGAKHTEEAKKKMSEARSKQVRKKGFKFSDESKKKMSESAIARAIRKGKVIKIYEPKPKQVKKIKEPLKKRILLTSEEKLIREKTRDACKRMVRRVLKMARIKKDGRRSELLLGYTKEDLRMHLESQFRPGMGWELRESFHIDHIKPIAQFFREGVYDPFIINALSNLQVLTPEENRKKSDSFGDKNRRQILVIDKNGTRNFV